MCVYVLLNLHVKQLVTDAILLGNGTCFIARM